MSIARKLTTQCILHSSANTEDNEGSLSKEENTVCCDRLRMPFDMVFDEVDDFKSTAYDLSLSSLTKKALKGESGIGILCGDRNEAHWMELLRACVTELLDATANPDKKVGTIKLCWFTVGADGAENLADILKPLETPQAVHKNINLVLRDLTGGRGTTVPGLVEVELTSIEDFDKMFEQLQSISPSAYTDTSSHSVVQISFTDKRIVEAVRVRKKDFVAQGALRDPAGLGRITFLQLSNLRSQGPKPQTTTPNSLSPQRMQCPLPPTRTTLFTRIDPPSEPVKIDFVTEAGSFYPWIEHSRQVLQWMENKRASTPFHKSRLLLLLKDVLLRRQPATLLLCLQPSAAQRSDHEDWLRVVWLLSRDFAPVPAVITPSASIATRKSSQFDGQEEEPFAKDNNNAENVETASFTWVYPGDDESTLHSQSAYSTSPSRSSLKSLSKQHSPADTDSVHWRAAMRARALDYGRAHTPRRRSRSNSRSNSRRQSRTESPRSPPEAQISPHAPSSSIPGGRSRVNSIDSHVNSIPGGSIEGGWDRTTTPGRSSSLHRVRLQLQTELSPLSHTGYTDDKSHNFQFENMNSSEGTDQGQTTISPTLSALSSQTSGGTPSALAHQKRFFRSTLERIEGQIFEGAHGAAPMSPPKRTKPVSPKPRVKHLTSKEMSAAMRALINKNKKLAESAAKDKEELLGSHDQMNNNSTAATAEVEDLKKRLAEAQGRCTTLETEQGVPLTYPTYDPNLFYTKWGPISPNKRRASVQTFLQARGAAVDPLGVAVDPANSRSQDSGHREIHHDAALLRVASRSNDSNDGEGAVGGLTKLNRIFGDVSEEKNIDEEQESARKESFGEENKGQSVEEQLRQALESLRVLGIKYEELECKYNALLASSSAQQMQVNPMGASRPLSVRSKPSPSPLADSSASPVRSPLASLVPSDENLVDKSHEAGESVVSVPAAHATSGAQETRDDGREVEAEHQAVPQGVAVEVETAEIASARRSVPTNEDEEAFVAVKKTQPEQSFVRPPVVTPCTVVEKESGAVVTNSTIAPISPTPSSSADSERRASALARTSIRTSPIPLDSIPSVSPIRFQRTRRAPREPVATPFESSFQASDFSEEHEHVVAADPSMSVSKVNASIDGEAEIGVEMDKGDLFAKDEEAFAKLGKDLGLTEQKTVVPSDPPRATADESTEAFVSRRVQEEEEEVSPEVVTIFSKVEGQHIIQEESEKQGTLPVESAPVHSTNNAADVSPANISIPVVSVAPEAVPEKIVNTVDSLDVSLEETVKTRPVSSRPRFQPKITMPRRSSISFKPSDNPADEPHVPGTHEETGSIDMRSVKEDVVSSARPPSPPLPPLPPLPPSISPAVPVTRRHRSVSFEQNDAELSAKELHLHNQVDLSATTPPPPLSPSQPSIKEAASTMLPGNISDQALPEPAELAPTDAVSDHLCDMTVSKENTELKLDSVESTQENIFKTRDEPTVSVLLFSPLPRQAQATERDSPIEEPTMPVMEPMGPPLSSPESIQLYHRFSQETEQASPIDDFMMPIMEAMGPPVSSPESVQPHHRFSISKTRFPQFLQQRLDDSLSSDGASDNEREIFEDFSFLPRETRADSMIEELENEDEFVEANKHATFNSESNVDGNDDDLSDASSAAATMRESSETPREEAATEGDGERTVEFPTHANHELDLFEDVPRLVEIAAVKIDIVQGERPPATNTPPSLSAVNVADTEATEEIFQPAMVQRSTIQEIAAALVAPSPSFVQQVNEACQHKPSAAVSPPPQMTTLPSVSNPNHETDINAEKPSFHHEGMYAQLAHATSPVRHETTSSSQVSATVSTHTSNAAHRIRPASVPPLNSTDSTPSPSRTNTNTDDVSSVAKGTDLVNHNIRTFSMDEMAEEVDKEEEVGPFNESALQDSPCPVLSVSSDADSQPVLPVPAGMYGQLAHSSSPVRPVSVPIPVSSGDEALTDKTKSLKTSRWSWLKKKST